MTLIDARKTKLHRQIIGVRDFLITTVLWSREIIHMYDGFCTT
jgi:hypothetical protein